jgi:glycosyltransferase involved in cell wall biosynthesis
VVGIKEGGVRETVRDGETGFLVDLDSAAMARALEKIFTNPQLGRQLGANARRWVEEEWTAEGAADRLEDSLYEVVAGTSSSFGS